MERIARLEAEVYQLRLEAHDARLDARLAHDAILSSRSALAGATWAGRVTLAFVGALGVIAGWLLKLLWVRPPS